MSQRIALIFGISGQDGSYLAHLLLTKGYEVHGVSRDIGITSFERLFRLGIQNRVKLHSGNLSEFRSVVELINRVKPDEIYNLSGQSSVGLSFELPVETFHSIAVGTINILEYMRLLKWPARLFQAESSECFGSTTGPCNEQSQFRPRSPYAVAKAASFWANSLYREAYGLHVCSGILANHESPLRGKHFVTRKIVRAAINISRGGKERLKLGNVLIERDWGWAPEYVDAMWRVLQLEKPGDHVIATGETHSLSELIEAIFGTLGLEWREHVEIDDALFRPSEILHVKLDPRETQKQIGWVAYSKMKKIAEYLVQCELEGKLGPVPWVKADLPDYGSEEKRTSTENITDYAIVNQ